MNNPEKSNKTVHNKNKKKVSYRRDYKPLRENEKEVGYDQTYVYSQGNEQVQRNKYGQNNNDGQQNNAHEANNSIRSSISNMNMISLLSSFPSSFPSSLPSARNLRNEHPQMYPVSSGTTSKTNVKKGGYDQHSFGQGNGKLQNNNYGKNIHDPQINMHNANSIMINPHGTIKNPRNNMNNPTNTMNNPDKNKYNPNNNMYNPYNNHGQNKNREKVHFNILENPNNMSNPTNNMSNLNKKNSGPNKNYRKVNHNSYKRATGGSELRVHYGRTYGYGQGNIKAPKNIYGK